MRFGTTLTKKIKKMKTSKTIFFLTFFVFFLFEKLSFFTRGGALIPPFRVSIKTNFLTKSLKCFRINRHKKDGFFFLKEFKYTSYKIFCLIVRKIKQF